MSRTVGARLLVGALGTLGVLGFAGVSESRDLTVEQIFTEPHLEGMRPGNEAISPDERWVAFAWNSEGRALPFDLWVVPIRGGAPRRLTSFHRDAHADSLRTALAAPVAKRDSLPKNLPRYFPTSTDYAVSAIAWAPDSRRIAFTARGELYVADSRDGAIERLTITGAGESDPAWSPDGRFLAFLREGSVWAHDFQQGRDLQLTPAGGDSLDPAAPQWSPDSRRIAFKTTNEHGLPDLLVPDYLGERVATRRIKEGIADGGVRVVDIRWLYGKQSSSDVGAEKPFPIVTVKLGPGKHPAIDRPVWSPDGASLAVSEVTLDTKTRKLHVARADSGSVRTVYVETDSSWVEPYDWVITDEASLEWAPDGRWIYFCSERDGWRHLCRVSPAGGAVHALTHGGWEVGWAHVLKDGRSAVVLTSRAHSFERQLERLNLESGALSALACGPGMSTHPRTGGRGETIVYRHSRFDTPTDLWAIDMRAAARPVQLTKSVPQSGHQADWVVPEVVHFKAHDGAALSGLLYKPRGFDPQRHYPCVVFVHGAGILQNVVDGWTFYSANYKFHTLLCQQGYAVFEVDYRGSLGYGRDFRAGVYGYLGGKDLDDELAGVDYLRSLGWVDTKRLGIYGGSYGGFMALMGLLRAPQTYACGAALRFVADWENYWRGNPWYCEQRLGSPQKNPTWYYRSSPIHFAAALEHPVLLLHGMRDDNVHFQDAAQFSERLIELGKPFELMMYPRESHGFTNPESWSDEYGRIEKFFAANLRPGAPASGTAPGATGQGAK